MVVGSWTLAAVMLAIGATPPEVVPLNSRNLKVPINIRPSDRKAIKELLLFASTDEGKTWYQAAVAKPENDAFIYFAPADGVYWLNFCIVDTQGRREPPDLYQREPAQRVLIDTLKPAVRLTRAERQGDEILVSWDIQEAHPDLATLKLEYRTPDAPPLMWYTAPATAALQGQARIPFQRSGPATVRLQIMDQAGNVGIDQAEVKTAGGEGVLAVSSKLPAAPGTSPAIPPPVFPTAGSNAPVPVQPAPPGGSPLAGSAWERMPAAPTPATAPEPRAPVDRTWVPAATAPSYPPSYPPGMDPASRGIATTAYSSTVPPAPVAPSRWPPASVVPLQLTNNPQVTLEYEVSRVGPSGLGSVELYLTQDEGQTWQRYADDPDLRSPITVNLPGEGVYGMRIVVGSKAGLGRRPPRSGDLPQMRLEVDTTPPAVKLFYPQPDPRRRDALVLTWSASDRNLPPNPITLQWAERLDGHWQTIAADLSNSGRYTWQLPADLPYRVYLRLSARDAAGNVAVDDLPEPVLVDLHEPEGQLIGIVPAAAIRH